VLSPMARDYKRGGPAQPAGRRAGGQCAARGDRDGIAILLVGADFKPARTAGRK